MLVSCIRDHVDIQYTKTIDVWPVRCILAEMLSGKPLFPGRDYHHQLTLILDILDTPTIDDFYGIKSRRVSKCVKIQNGLLTYLCRLKITFVVYLLKREFHLQDYFLMQIQWVSNTFKYQGIAFSDCAL
jgi:serine/threonine protein kinase